MGTRQVFALWAFVGVRLGVVLCWNILVLRKSLKSLHAKSQLFSCYSFRDLRVHTDGRTDVQADMACSTWLVILIKKIYTL